MIMGIYRTKPSIVKANDGIPGIPVNEVFRCESCQIVTAHNPCQQCTSPTIPHPEQQETEGYCLHCGDGPFPVSELRVVTWEMDPYYQDPEGSDLTWFCKACVEKEFDDAD